MRTPPAYLNPPEQIAHLQQHGMTITDLEHATDCVRRIGYYRLSGYWRPFQVNRPDKAEAFASDTQFANVLALYWFDKRLRFTLLDALEQIEIALRAQIAYHLGAKDPMAHQNKRLLNPEATAQHYDKWLAAYSRDVQQSYEPFIKHERDQHGGAIPIWVAIELWSFGRLSMFFTMMRGSDRRVVAAQFGVSNHRIMAGWLRAMAIVRNIAAHHSRLWNRAAIGRLPQKGEFPNEFNPPMLPDRRSYDRLYPVLCVIVFLTRQISPNSQWPRSLRSMLEQLHSKTGRSLREMGFPSNWEQSSFWRG